jgi:hypothetical protein
MGQYDQRIAVKETEYPIDVRAMLDPALPDILRSDQFFEIGGRHQFQIFQETEYPNHFLGHLARQGIEEILNGTFPVFSSIEEDRSIHDVLLTHMLTCVKGIFTNRGTIGNGFTFSILFSHFRKYKRPVIIGTV